LQPIFDASWHQDALAGEEQAIRRLADGALRPLYRFCLYRVGGNHHLCEEVVQEALLGAIRRLDRYDPARSGGDIFPWLAGLARNEVRRVLARERLATDLEAFWKRMDEQLLSLYAMLDREPFGEELLARAETREMVNATMAQLPPHYGQALEAKYVRGQSVREIASLLGTSMKGAESLLTRARSAFRETFLALARNLPAEPAT
jgi:RNA polymerase sigma-70 factor (ECF subfamily)